jgi:hypothetical protein
LWSIVARCGSGGLATVAIGGTIGAAAILAADVAGLFPAECFA